MTQTKANWIITGVQATVVGICTTIIVTVGTNVINTMTKFYKSVDEIRITVAELKQNDAKQDASISTHTLLINNRQEAEVELDKKISQVKATGESFQSQLTLILKFLHI